MASKSEIDLYSKFQGAAKALESSFTTKQLIEKTICSSATEDCFYRRCIDCLEKKPSIILLEGLDVEIYDLASWSMWKKTRSRYELLHLSGTLETLLEELDDLWSAFLIHSFYTAKQRDYIALIKETSSLTTFSVIQLDFAQNFSLIIQREIQSAYYSRQQATIFTVYVRVGNEHRNMAIISDYLSHDTKFVFCAQQLIMDFVKREYPNIVKVNYVSDGAAAHFKSKCLLLLIVT